MSPSTVAPLESKTTLSSVGPIRVALYGRYSSDRQNERSVDAQLLVCGEYSARRPNWQIVAEFRDEGISGASIAQRPGMQKLLAAATQGQFDIVLAEAMDRLSRDDVDMPYINKKLKFAGVMIFTVAENEVTKLHVGLKGTMNSMFLDDLRQKTHRGIEWAVCVEGKIVGRAYGYQTVREFDASGEPLRGLRRINPKEAEIVRRILKEYADGVSPDAIATRLTDEGVPGPSGKPEWAASTIRGDARRGTGIINNELYIGKNVWNRTHHPKHPDTGKPVNRVNPREQWKIADKPELRIVSDELWGRVRAKQRELAQKYARVIEGSRAAHNVRVANALNSNHRPDWFLSGLIVCGECGGPYTALGKGRYSCTRHRRFKLCPNGRTVHREEIDKRVLAGLCGPLLDQVNVDHAVEALVAETERLNRERHCAHDSARKSSVDIRKKINHVIAAIEKGAYSDALNAKLRELEGEKQEAERLASEAPTEICIPKNFAEMLRRKVANLPETLRNCEECEEATLLVRELVTRVTVTPCPEVGKFTLTLQGCLGTLLDRLTGTTNTVWPSNESGARINRRPYSVELAI